MEIDMNDYDIEMIRSDLKDYYGTAMVNASPIAMVDLISLDNKSDYEILSLAVSIGMNIDNYYIKAISKLCIVLRNK